MSERTADDKALREPIWVTLCGKKVGIPIPSYRANKEWRNLFVGYQERCIMLQQSYGGGEGDEIDFKKLTPEQMGPALKAGFEVMVDAKIDLLFAAIAAANGTFTDGQKWDRDFLEDNATERELREAAEIVIEALSPLEGGATST